MVKKKLNIKRVVLVILLFIFILILSFIGYVMYELSPVDKNNTEGSYDVMYGSSVYEIFEDLENKEIIRNSFFLKVYSKITGVKEVDAGTYNINPSMSSIEILNALKGNNTLNAPTVTFTFKEGENIRDLIKTLEEVTDIKESDVINKLKDDTYLDSLINEYWFLTEEIKDENIYYSLEGYLFPDTYEIYIDANIEDVFRKMLDQMENKLSSYKEKIESSNFTTHEFLTLASIIELESAGTENRDTVAGVFLNRLNDNWALESCVTTYYAFNINMGDRDLETSEIYDCRTKYNTRCQSFEGLPVGPIGNPGLLSLDALINYEEHDYYYFASDKNGNLYFSETLYEHENTVSRLQNEGLWYEY